MRLKVVVILGIGVLLAFSRTRPALLSQGRDREASEQELRVRAQIDAYIARVREEETFEELAAGLSVREASAQVQAAGYSVGGHAVQFQAKFEGCLANRRVARLFEILSDREDADGLCRKLFDEKRTLLKESFQEHLKARDAIGGPQLQPIELVRFPTEFVEPLSSEAAALSAALFLSAEFCPVDEVLRQLDAWNALAEECDEAFRQARADWVDPKLAEFEQRRLMDTLSPERRFQLSLLASLYERRFWDDPGGTPRDHMGALIPADPAPVDLPELPVPIEAHYYRIILCSWDAPTTLSGSPDLDVFWPDHFGDFRAYDVNVADWSEWLDAVLLNLRERLLAAVAEDAG